MNQESPSRDAIAERAYLLWEQAGRPAGRDEEFWLRAEADLVAPMSPSDVPPIPTPPPIKDAVKIPGCRPPRPRVPKRA